MGIVILSEALLMLMWQQPDYRGRGKTGSLLLLRRQCRDDKTGIKEVKILGPGCAKCKSTYQVIEKVINENNLDVKLTKIEDITEIMSYNVMGTPAVVVDEVVKIKGHVPSESEIKQIFGI